MQRVVYAFCLSKITKFVICLCLPRVQEVVRRVRRDASVSAAGRSHTQHALWVTLNTWLKPVTGPVSGYLGSFWLPLPIRFSKQTPSYDEICSFCLHRCRCLNGKLKTCKVFENLHPAPQCNKFHCKLVTKKFKTSCLSKRTRGLYFLVLCCDTFARENYSSRTSMCDHLT